ncbi:MAG: GIY-YIG nuclease family protein, partial [Actinobacteria bacterium]|nr:GIY-YIG nuclease family protein [Actinomycetota bacterium]
PCVYILAHAPRGVLYVGVTSNLPARVWQHQHSVVDGFTHKYNVHLLVWYERFDTMPAAIAREKQLKAGNRTRKLALVEAFNPTWRDLSGELGSP